jgi:hypothetical protein
VKKGILGWFLAVYIGQYTGGDVPIDADYWPATAFFVWNTAGWSNQESTSSFDD